ncbi:co-chaperone GroES [Candidatus Berkelbacteria bacterium RIFCSPLOWO2_01_FULL_50_28]|uniref:Co-chaperonin GroES n=1 Tax=Candidatus Berkelbacteria bacterium RIFCSPLOWO2_01_FULL_50_28 TaxID=1797471 RepID=A0A1F5EC59_9BACT|nr:MAG: co-chaperone GroES [Candidatus Berkelbacteria bacterium RIFCSPHIGHO2_01_FULL_50_36]OGD62917.1 MAG: co-chaperone GroES [Candidatus Berkelbacteria bacterium RIFCSPHIGHO2_12_FULL_50_11]OGD64992.1 MAG: co-chaperone GroES [Candidatus Berkelbacteria bacterium RIFCSPLOWO2_01_FULL_50_28]
MQLQPLSDRLVVKPLDAETVSKSGIVIPDTAKEKPQEGEVIAVGPGRVDKDGQRIEMEVKKGDKVLFGKYAGDEFKLDGVEYKIIREDEVLGILKG